MDADEKLALRNHLVLEEFAEGGLVLDPLSGGLFELNGSGLMVLELLNRRMTPREITRALAEDADSSQGQIERDVFSFLTDLSKRGLLMSEDSSGQCCAGITGPPRISQRDIVVQDRDAVVAEVDRGCALLYSMAASATSTVLNTTAFWLWELCRQPVSVETLCRLVFDEYDEVTEEEAIEDVRSFLEKMLHGGFLIRTEPDE